MMYYVSLWGSKSGLDSVRWNKKESTIQHSSFSLTPTFRTGWVSPGGGLKGGAGGNEATGRKAPNATVLHQQGNTFILKINITFCHQARCKVPPLLPIHPTPPSVILYPLPSLVPSRFPLQFQFSSWPRSWRMGNQLRNWWETIYHVFLTANADRRAVSFTLAE